MTDNPNAQRNSAGQLTWLWMIMSLIVVSGFLFWLGANSRPSSVAVAEAVETAPEDVPVDVAGAVVVPPADLATNPNQFYGQTVRLVDIQVASTLGSQAFWTSLPAGTNTIPFLIRLDPTLVGQGVTVAGGETVTVVGRVLEMNMSVVEAWERDGVLADENQKMEAEFATAFLEVVRLERSGGQ